jgi:Arylsulfatase A and related enzymes
MPRLLFSVSRGVVATGLRCWSALAALAMIATVARAAPPNVIFILTDDLGYGDLSCYGQRKFATPAIDRLAAGGVRLTSHYAGAPVCAPARASLMLGVTQGHANVRDNQFDKAIEDNHTLGTVLRRAGYVTAAIGKWGLHGQPVASDDGADPDAPAHPLNRGFDYYYGLLRHIDGHEHFPKEAPYFTEKAKRRGPVRVWEGRVDVTAGLDKCYTTDLFTARAKKFIVDHAASAPTQPFFLYLAYDTPHGALELPTQAYPAGGGLQGGVQWLGESGRMINTASGEIDSWVDPDVAAGRYDDDRDPSTPEKPWQEAYLRHATSVRRIDDCVGDLLQLLVDLKLDENTLVVFTSDNGPADEAQIPGMTYSPEFFGSYGPFEGIKRDLWEGGTRVPTLVRWPKRFPAGQVLARPSAQWDWLPTLADAAGLPAPARGDGISLLPELEGRVPERPRDPLYFEYAFQGRTPAYSDFAPNRRNRARNQMQALRWGDYVGVRYDVQSADDEFEIYNVIDDPGETKNLSADPRLAHLRRELKDAALRHRRPEESAPRPYDGALVPALAPVKTAEGVSWRHYRGSFPWVPDFAGMTPAASGSALRPDLANVPGRGDGGVLFTGYLQAPTDGEYRFYLKADTGAVLRIHDAMVLDADYGYSSGSERSATIRLQAGLHPFRLAGIHRSEEGVSFTTLEWSGPGFSRQPVPPAAFFRPAAETAPVH